MSTRECVLAAAVAAALLLPGLGSFTLVDPWEGHYAEVGRRILQDDDWLQLRWQTESFHSKPALTPWLIAASLRTHGIADDGGYSGELATSTTTAWAVRLPFALCGVAGLLAVWLALRRLASRRAAWLGLIALGSAPFYALVARQAITDIPMVMATTGAIALFALALHDGDVPLRRWRGLTALHGLLAAVAVVALVQVAYNTSAFVADPRVGPGIRASQPHLWVSVPVVAALAALVALTCRVWPGRTRRAVYLMAGYALVGVGLLAKGPPGAAVVLVVCSLYIVATGQWRTIWRLRPLEGALVIALVAAPWHVAIALRDGQPWLAEYVGHHWLKRAASGVHEVNRAGEGTVAYFAHQLGIGLWPLVAFVPSAVSGAVSGRADDARGHLRTLALLWAVVATVLFTAIETKYHHYVLPAVPGFAVLLALWLDDVLAERVRVGVAPMAIGLGIAAAVTWDVVSQQERFIELFCYRYDRPWPSGPPWQVDLSAELWLFGAAFAAAGAAACARRVQRWAIVGALACAVGFGYWVTVRYMRAAGPHWGQGHLHRAYYQQRRITGVTLHSGGSRIIAVPAAIPPALAVDDPMRVVDAAGHERPGTVLAVFADSFWIHAPGLPPRTTRTRLTVDAERLVAFNLFWRAELFWSGGELWGPTADMHTSFRYRNDAGARDYLARPDSAGRRFYAITEASQVDALRRILPPGARDSLEVIDRSSNKFTLSRFEIPPPP